MPRLAYDDDEDALDDRGVLRDGRSLRVQAAFMDSKAAPPTHRFHDIYSPPGTFRGGHASLCGHRPGFADASLIDHNAEQEKASAWEQVGARLRDAWRTPPPEMPYRATGTRQERQEASGRSNPPRDPSRVPTPTQDGFKDEASREAWLLRGEQLANAWK